MAIVSILTGSILLIGAYHYAQTLGLEAEGKSRPDAKLLKFTIPGVFGTAAVAAVALLLTSMGTVMLLTPCGVVRSITARRITEPNGRQAATLVFQTRNLPFSRLKRIELRPNEAFLGQKVRALELDYSNVPLAQAGEFTATASETAAAPLATDSAAGRFWQFWRMNTGKALRREGIALVRLGPNGHRYKLDLWGAELLDHGRPLKMLTMEDPEDGLGLLPRLWRKYMGKKPVGS
jgi:hypothetical protein